MHSESYCLDCPQVAKQPESASSDVSSIKLQISIHCRKKVADSTPLDEISASVCALLRLGLFNHNCAVIDALNNTVTPSWPFSNDQEGFFFTKKC